MNKLEGTHRVQTSITEVNKFQTYTGLILQKLIQLVKNFKGYSGNSLKIVIFNDYLTCATGTFDRF